MAKLFGVCLCVVAIAPGLLAQQEPTPRFDVASIRRNVSGAESTSLRPLPNGIEGVNVTIRRLIRIAYGVADFQIVDAPGWFDSEHYDLTARAAEAVSPATLPPMMKALLAERFGLRVSEVPREVPGFELRVERADARGLRRASVPCALAPAAAAPPPGQPLRPVCFSSIPGDMTARGVTSELLARQLTAIVRQPVVDRTGLSDAFDFELRWQSDIAAGDADVPPLVTALREQLGLRLVPARSSVPAIVVTAAARPSDN